MPNFNIERRVPHSAGRMFDLVADVEAYPKFLPLISALTVVSRAKEGEDDVLVTRMEVGYQFVEESFLSRVRLRPGVPAIEGVAMEGGPFERMDMNWRFAPDGDGACTIVFEVEYAFRSKMLGMLFGGAFDNAVRKFVDAFEARAAELYGAG